MYFDLFHKICPQISDPWIISGGGEAMPLTVVQFSPFLEKMLRSWGLWERTKKLNLSKYTLNGTYSL